MFVKYFGIKQLYGFNSADALQYLLVWLTKTFSMAVSALCVIKGTEKWSVTHYLQIPFHGKRTFIYEVLYKKCATRNYIICTLHLVFSHRAAQLSDKLHREYTRGNKVMETEF